jgi:hypothetical protein
MFNDLKSIASNEELFKFDALENKAKRREAESIV